MSDELDTSNNQNAAVGEQGSACPVEAVGLTEDAGVVAAKPKKKGKGKVVLLAAVIVVVVLFGGTGVAYAVTHDDPHFCNAICHTPMDPYVDSYDNNVSVNEKEASTTGPTAAPLSVTVHKESDQGINCLKCHEPDMGEQISEGMKWVTGGYSLPLQGFKLVASDNPKEGEVSGTQFCLREGCHTQEDYDALKKVTKESSRPVHSGSHGYTECSSCHQTHEQSVLLCAQCHADVKLPDGWVKAKAK